MLTIKSLGFYCNTKITALYDNEMTKTYIEKLVAEISVKIKSDKFLHMTNFEPTLDLIDKSRIHSELWVSINKMGQRREPGLEFEFCLSEQLPLIKKAFPSFKNLSGGRVEQEYVVTKITALYDKLSFSKEFAPHKELLNRNELKTFIDNEAGLVDGCKDYSLIFFNKLDIAAINASILSDLLAIGTNVGFPLVGFLFARKAMFVLGLGSAFCCCSQLCLELDLQKVFSNTFVKMSGNIFLQSEAACASLYQKAYIVVKSQAILFFKNPISLRFFSVASAGTWILYGSLGSSAVCTTNKYSTTNFQKDTEVLQATIVSNVYHASSFCKDIVVAVYDGGGPTIVLQGTKAVYKEGMKILREIIKGNGK